ncbi:hypothetical protein DL89DRAFT_311034 [Linderina pennispora]|uniref:Uncharacterized protein n=1 Tax=Linderina pennispora TaxID=61395 RepID=A0A1Y1WF47_9FUNG|nr:uncharacterized protein DL89DRAFT_311034 [Linderina pennispora]ORX71784.1 hypothetical protein DL89DRAFT_311034 [Linderina pennispora]
MTDMAYRKRSLDLSMADDSVNPQRTNAALPPIRSIPEFNSAVSSGATNHMDRSYVPSGPQPPQAGITQQQQQQHQQQQSFSHPLSSPGPTTSSSTHPRPFTSPGQPLPSAYQQQQKQQQQQQPLLSSSIRYHNQQHQHQPGAFREPADLAPTVRASPMSSSHSGNSPHARPSSTVHNSSMLDDGTTSAGETIKVARNWSREETLSLVRAIGRHYDSLKRCKTNQERSNVWHTIHKEHSSQFPGRSKKASQVCIPNNIIDQQKKEKQAISFR